MASCEKCWKDAGYDTDRYAKLIIERGLTPCTPEEVAGDGELCFSCKRWTRHQHTGDCMNPECKQLN